MMSKRIIIYSTLLLSLVLAGHAHLRSGFEMGHVGGRYVIGEVPDGFTMFCRLDNGLNVQATYHAVTTHTPTGPVFRNNLLSEKIIVTGKDWRWQLPEYSDDILNAARQCIDSELAKRNLTAMTHLETNEALKETRLHRDHDH